MLDIQSLTFNKHYAYSSDFIITYNINCTGEFLHVTTGTAITHLSHHNSIHLYVCLSHGWISQKRCKIKSPNFTVSCLEDSSFKIRKAALRFKELAAWILNTISATEVW